MQVRLAEIAERAGVSISTVSRVLNDKPGVNASTRRQVLTAVDVLGYDRPARLRPRVAGLVGVVVPEIENPFFPRLAQLIELNLGQHGYTPVLCSQSLGGIHEDDYVRSLLEHGVAGIIFVSGMHAIADGDPGRYQRLTDSGLPVVLINGFLPDAGSRVHRHRRRPGRRPGRRPPGPHGAHQDRPGAGAGPLHPRTPQGGAPSRSPCASTSTRA